MKHRLIGLYMGNIWVYLFIDEYIQSFLHFLRCLQTDWGGQRTLQRKWTSFLKARMVCSVPEYELHLNILRDVFVLQERDAHRSIFYGVFGLEW